MRYILLLLVSLISTAGYSQKNFIENGKLNGVLPLDSSKSVSYQFVESVDGANKDQLFRRARKWFATTYNSSKDVLQVNDSESGELIGKGLFSLRVLEKRVWLPFELSHTITVEVKENRYRITVNGLLVEGQKPVAQYKLPFIATTQAHYTTFYESIDQKVRQTVESINNAMRKSSDF